MDCGYSLRRSPFSPCLLLLRRSGLASARDAQEVRSYASILTLVEAARAIVLIVVGDDGRAGCGLLAHWDRRRDRHHGATPAAWKRSDQSGGRACKLDEDDRGWTCMVRPNSITNPVRGQATPTGRSEDLHWRRNHHGARRTCTVQAQRVMGLDSRAGDRARHTKSNCQTVETTAMCRICRAVAIWQRTNCDHRKRPASSLNRCARGTRCCMPLRPGHGPSVAARPRHCAG